MINHESIFLINKHDKMYEQLVLSKDFIKLRQWELSCVPEM